MAALKIILGNKNYSSWSLRGWLALKATGEPFDEEVIPLDQPGTREALLKHSPSGRAPALHHGEILVWDSLAICGYLAETFPAARLWPDDPAAKAAARSVSAEMHAGFAALRGEFPMNIRSSFPGREISPEAQADVNRVMAIWRQCRSRYGAGNGDFLFGRFTVADAMYAPVATRFRTYRIDLEREADAYCDAIIAWPAMQEWIAAAGNEPMVIDRYEF
ncbi:MAG TPA: glutathione S-transferase family protein [Stellaceae bacterium]|nr:glutathione S-transferase family protein [Stellaceae bacterium]